MLTFLTYALVFLAGCAFCDLVTWLQERRAILRITRIMLAESGPIDTVVIQWSADPHNWCDRPGCHRCWGSGGSS